MWALLILSVASAAPSKSILRFEQGLTRYAVEKTSKELVLYASPMNLRIPIQPCNRQIVDELWKDIEVRFKFLPPMSKRRTAASESVELSGKKRALKAWDPLGQKAARFFRAMPTEFLNARMTSGRRCKR